MACRVDGKGSFNLGGYCNERVTELADLIQVETDPEKRQTLIDEANRIHSEEVGHIPLHQQPLSWGVRDNVTVAQRPDDRSEEHTSELQSLMRISYAVFCLNKNTENRHNSNKHLA